MKNNLRAVKSYFDAAMEYISSKEKMEEMPRILYLGDMSLDGALEARKNGITPAVVRGHGQDMINFISKNNYRLVSIENGIGVAYYSPNSESVFDCVTNGDSISPVLALEANDEDIELVVGEVGKSSLISVSSSVQDVVNKIYSKKTVSENVAKLVKIQSISK